MALIVRDALEGDIPYILSTWLRSYRQTPGGSRYRTTDYFAIFHDFIKNLLTNGSARVAYDSDDTTHTILGWVAFAPDTLHYVYTRFSARRRRRRFGQPGVATTLLDGLKFEHVTFTTPDWDRFRGEQHAK